MCRGPGASSAGAERTAALAVEFMPALEAEARQRQGARNDLTTSGSQDPEVPNRARVEAGALVGVSGASVDRAKRVKREDPDMFELVKAGTLPVTEADRKIRERKEHTTTDSKRGTAHVLRRNPTPVRPRRSEPLSVGVLRDGESPAFAGLSS